MKIPRRYGQYLFAAIQSGLTCGVASAIASAPFMNDGTFAMHFFMAWAISWATMLPIAIAAAPFITRIVGALTVPESG